MVKGHGREGCGEIRRETARSARARHGLWPGARTASAAGGIHHERGRPRWAERPAPAAQLANPPGFV